VYIHGDGAAYVSCRLRLGGKRSGSSRADGSRTTKCNLCMQLPRVQTLTGQLSSRFISPPCGNVVDA